MRISSGGMDRSAGSGTSSQSEAQSFPLFSEFAVSIKSFASLYIWILNLTWARRIVSKPGRADWAMDRVVGKKNRTKKISRTDFRIFLGICIGKGFGQPKYKIQFLLHTLKPPYICVYGQ